MTAPLGPPSVGTLELSGSFRLSPFPRELRVRLPGQYRTWNLIFSRVGSSRQFCCCPPTPHLDNKAEPQQRAPPGFQSDQGPQASAGPSPCPDYQMQAWPSSGSFRKLSEPFRKDMLFKQIHPGPTPSMLGSPECRPPPKHTPPHGSSRTFPDAVCTKGPAVPPPGDLAQVTKAAQQVHKGNHLLLGQRVDPPPSRREGAPGVQGQEGFRFGTGQAQRKQGSQKGWQHGATGRHKPTVLRRSRPVAARLGDALLPSGRS